MYSSHEVQVAKSRINEWHKAADAARMLDDAHHEQDGQDRVSLVMSAMLKGLGMMLVRAGNRLDARAECQ